MSLFRPWLGPESLNPDNLSSAYQQQLLTNQKSYIAKLASLHSGASSLSNSTHLDNDQGCRNSGLKYDCNNTQTVNHADRNHSSNSRASTATMKLIKDNLELATNSESSGSKQNYYSYYYNYYYNQLVYYASLQNQQHSQNQSSHNSNPESTEPTKSRCSAASTKYRPTSKFSLTAPATALGGSIPNQSDLYQSVTTASSQSAASSPFTCSSSSNSSISEDDIDADDYNPSSTVTESTATANSTAITTATISDNVSKSLQSSKFQLLSPPNQHKQQYRSHEPNDAPLSGDQRPPTATRSTKNIPTSTTTTTSNQLNGIVPNCSNLDIPTSNQLNKLQSKLNHCKLSNQLIPEQRMLNSSGNNLLTKKVTSPIVDIQNILAFQNIFLDNLNYGKKRASKSTAEQRPKKFICHECKSGFSNRSQLNSHIRTHTGERPFVCDFKNCHKSFTRNEELTRHRRIHSGIRPYPCRWCDKRFGRKDHLRKHERTHERRLRSTILLNYSSNLPAAFQSHFALSPALHSTPHAHHHQHHHQNHHSNPPEQLAKLEASSSSALNHFSNKTFANPFIRPDLVLPRPNRTESSSGQVDPMVHSPLPPPSVDLYRTSTVSSPNSQPQPHPQYRPPTHHKSFAASSAVSI